MIIEVHGCSARNKGAELMLLAIRQYVSEAFPHARLAVDHWFGTYEERARYGLRTRLAPVRRRRSSLAVALMPSSCREVLGLVVNREIDAVLDASGFAFGDVHGPEPVERMAVKVSRWNAQGKPVVLLPQAFGPFTGLRIRRAFETVLRSADLVFARDPLSLEAIRSIGVASPNVHLAPDFTCVLPGHLPPGFVPRSGRVCLVPNSRMLDRTNDSTASAYIPFLARCVEACRQLGLVPFVLLHDAHEDARVAAKLNSSIRDPLEVITCSDPLELKGVLGQPEFVIGSRFHALVGALSQQVPVIAAGWSHKYSALLADYGCENNLLSVDADCNKILRLMSSLTDNAAKLAIRRTLADALPRQQQEVRVMWQKVGEVLRTVSSRKHHQS